MCDASTEAWKNEFDFFAKLHSHIAGVDIRPCPKICQFSVRIITLHIRYVCVLMNDAASVYIRLDVELCKTMCAPHLGRIVRQTVRVGDRHLINVNNL